MSKEQQMKSKGKPDQSAAPAVAPKPQIMRVKSGVKLRGAREKWYEVLLKMDGKSVADYIAATKKDPPALTKNNTAENPTGWVRWFVRSGTLTLETPK